MLLYIFDLIGVAVFAMTGALAGLQRGLDLFGVTVVAAMTAIGGGTLRDLILNRHPVFWVKNAGYLYVICAAVGLTVLGQPFWVGVGASLLVLDALGLGLFALSGAQLTEADGHSGIVIVLMGTMTGVAGGVVRDLLSGVPPVLLRRDVYATAAVAGIVGYLLMQRIGVPRKAAFLGGMALTVGLRLLAMRFHWQLPAFY